AAGDGLRVGPLALDRYGRRSKSAATKIIRLNAQTSTTCRLTGVGINVRDFPATVGTALPRSAAAGFGAFIGIAEGTVFSLEVVRCDTSGGMTGRGIAAPLLRRQNVFRASITSAGVW